MELYPKRHHVSKKKCIFAPEIDESGRAIRSSICGEYTTTRVPCFFNMYKRQPLGTQGGTKEIEKIM